MTFLWITLVVIPSPILIFISSEAIAIICALKGYSPIGLALALAVGQSIGFTFLCLFGEQLADRWARIKRLRDKIEIDRYREQAPKLIAWASLIGIPPLNLSCLAAAAVKARMTHLLPLLFSGRLLRYWIIASVPNFFEGYVNLDLLPTWLNLT